MTATVRRDPNPGDSVQEATIVALKRVLDPLLDLMFDAGITVQEFNKIARDRAVRVAMRRLVWESGRESKSRVAIMTGLPRSEVTKILTSNDSSTSEPAPHPVRRVLAAWHDDHRFLAPNGQPAVLPIFGKKLSFEQLVDRYASGIPVRAMLDELTKSGAVERIDDQKVVAKARVPAMSGLTTRSIAAIGERGREFLETLAHNMRSGSQPFFEAFFFNDTATTEMAAILRRDIQRQGANFINAATLLLSRARIKRDPKTVNPQTCRLGLTVYYFQGVLPNIDQPAPSPAQPRRKNLRRRSSDSA